MFPEGREDSTEKPGFLPFSDKYRCEHPKQLLAALKIFAGCYWRGSLNIREQQRRVRHSSDKPVRHIQRKAARPKLLQSGFCLDSWPSSMKSSSAGTTPPGNFPSKIRRIRGSQVRVFTPWRSNNCKPFFGSELTNFLDFTSSCICLTFI